MGRLTTLQRSLVVSDGLGAQAHEWLGLEWLGFEWLGLEWHTSCLHRNTFALGFA